MIVMSTPVYESVRVAALEGIPAATGYPPHHPDIYRQLCSEFGHDPRTGERLAPRQWQTLKLPTSAHTGPLTPRTNLRLDPAAAGGRRARPALAARKTDVRLATQRPHVVAPVATMAASRAPARPALSSVCAGLAHHVAPIPVAGN